MSGPGNKKLDRATGRKGVPYEDPSLASEKRLTEILLKPVPAGSTRRRDELLEYFSSVSMNEAARLYSKLSNPKDKHHVLMTQRLNASSVQKALGLLEARSGRQTARPIPQRLTDQTLKDEFLSILEAPVDPAKSNTSVEDVFEEERSTELFGELAQRGEAFSSPDPDTERRMALDLKLHQATQRFNYAGIDIDHLKSEFERPPVTNVGGTAKGYYRVLEELGDGQLYDITEDSVKRLLPSAVSYAGPETIEKPYVDSKGRVLAIRYPTQVRLKTNKTKTHVWEIWWFADETNEFKALLSRAELAANYNPSPDARFFVGGDLEATLRWQLGILMRPLLGDSMILDQMNRELAGAVASGATHLAAQKGAQKIQGKPVGGGGADDPAAAKKKVDLSKPGAFGKLANASADEVAAALRDPSVFRTYKHSLKKGPDAQQAAADIQDLGRVIAQHTTKGSGGAYKMNKAVSDAVWALPEHLRGVLVEHALAHTQYKGWFHAGQLNQGFFPDIDFAITTPGSGPQLRASVKSVNTFAKGYEKQLTEKLPEHVETLVTSTQNDITAGRRPAVTTIDVRLPPGSGVAKSELAQTLRDRIPKHLRPFFKIEINEI